MALSVVDFELISSGGASPVQECTGGILTPLGFTTGCALAHDCTTSNKQVYVYGNSESVWSDGHIQGQLHSIGPESRGSVLIARMQGTVITSVAYALMYVTGQASNTYPQSIVLAKGPISTLSATNWEAILFSRSIGINDTSTSTYTFKMEVYNNSDDFAVIKVYVGASLLFEYIDETPLGDGRWGFGGISFDATSKIVYLDNIEIDIPPGAIPSSTLFVITYNTWAGNGALSIGVTETIDFETGW